jgi:hypothetical protein
MLHYRCVDCRPGGRRGNTEQVFARWRRPVASSEAPVMVMMYWALRSVLHWRTAMAVEIAREGGAFVSGSDITHNTSTSTLNSTPYKGIMEQMFWS